MYIAAIFALLVGAFFILARALKGPTAYDRILAMNAMGTKTVILVALLGFASDRPDFLDLAIVYALVSFITTIAILKYIEKGRLD
ncbi:MAG: cation:proton antiporter [Myxococcales bacterium]|nr:cation:proton antiporter [Myxococcales bacterium]MCB9702361.1 cation:proton antiporter [Myxococcales bacterium]